MGNRKEQIENLKNEINTKQRELNKLELADQSGEAETEDDLTQEDIKDILSNI